MLKTMQPITKNRVCVTAVIVLYRRSFADAVAFQTLELAFSMARSSGLSLLTLLYDNTPECTLSEDLPAHVVYRAAIENRGLAEAYNWAVERAEENGSEWLLTLDQDTSLPQDFLLNMHAIAAEVANDPTIAAIVPQIFERHRILSPYHFLYNAIPAWYPAGFRGIPRDGVFAFNSAALVRVATLRQIHGYHPLFWLDQSDSFLFRQLQRYGKRVFVAGNIGVEHNFSMLEMKNRMPAERYRNVLLAETAFWDIEMSRFAGSERLIRLLVRLIRQSLLNDLKHLRQTTKEFVWRRLFWTRKHRLQAWEEETKKKFPFLTQIEKATRPLQISVCMATYNGFRYVELQLRSILKQLGPRDELIVIDDASSDATVDLVRSMLASVPDTIRIQFIIHVLNKGVGVTFEEALRRVNGDLVLFADQDDIWVDNKVVSFRKAFEQDPKIKIVTSLITVIDEDGKPVANSGYRNRFHAGFWHNLLRNRFQGSAMSMRASMIGMVLPFPKNVDFLHDYWIGIRNAWVGGATVCLPEPLLLYRRHSQNVSGRMPRAKQVKVRLQLLWNVLTTALRGYY